MNNDYHRAWRAKNADKVRAAAAKYREKNRELMLQRTAEWRAKNPEYKQRANELKRAAYNPDRNAQQTKQWRERNYHVNEETKLLAFHRWDKGGAGDDVVVVANFENQARGNYAIGFPQPGLWRLRLNSDWRGYSNDFSGFASHDVTATAQDYDGCPAQGCVDIGPYSLLILLQDAQPAG